MQLRPVQKHTWHRCHQRLRPVCVGVWKSGKKGGGEQAKGGRGERILEYVSISLSGSYSCVCGWQATRCASQAALDCLTDTHTHNTHTHTHPRTHTCTDLAKPLCSDFQPLFVVVALYLCSYLCLCLCQCWCWCLCAAFHNFRTFCCRCCCLRLRLNLTQKARRMVAICTQLQQQQQRQLLITPVWECNE